MSPHARRLIKTLASVLFVLLLAAVTYQGVATALERRAYRYPGRLVPVGDHQLHLHCLGSGAPTIVLEAPALGFSGSWALVQEALAETMRACAYDRAGLGWSEASDGPFDSNAVRGELNTLLMEAGEQPPYLLVGDGLGAAYVTLFAARFPAETAGVVLLDSPVAAEPRRRTLRASPSPWLARIGVLRLSRALGGNASVPGPRGGAVSAFSMRPDHLTRAAQEVRQIGEVVDSAAAVTIPADIPVRRLESSDGASLLGDALRAAEVTRIVSETVQEWRGAHP